MQVILDELFQFRAVDQRYAIAVRELLARTPNHEVVTSTPVVAL
jgi:hypothetical protein